MQRRWTRGELCAGVRNYSKPGQLCPSVRRVGKWVGFILGISRYCRGDAGTPEEKGPDRPLIRVKGRLVTRTGNHPLRRVSPARKKKKELAQLVEVRVKSHPPWRVSWNGKATRDGGRFWIGEATTRAGDSGRGKAECESSQKKRQLWLVP